jgi:hypothetical protein
MVEIIASVYPALKFFVSVESYFDFFTTITPKYLNSADY